MNRFSFQIEPTAEFKPVQVPSRLATLKLKFLGNPRAANRQPAARTTASPNPTGFGQVRNSLPGRPSRPSLASRLRPTREVPARPAPSPAAPPAKAAPAPGPVEYRGYLISPIQIADCRWIAHLTRIGGEPIVADGPPPVAQRLNAFMARFMAIANAELEIDEIGRGDAHCLRDLAMAQ